MTRSVARLIILDYGMGNLRSVQKAFEKNGADAKISSSVKDVEKAAKLVVPGVGAFWAAMEELKKRGLVEPVREKIKSGIPYLGLCLGLQLLFDKSEEGRDGRSVKGLGILPGIVKRFVGRLKVPHMGWNTLAVRQKSNPLLNRVTSADFFYFVHSYYAVPEEKDVVAAETFYGIDFCSAIRRDAIFATQFHPEKSQESGLNLIRNFIRL